MCVPRACIIDPRYDDPAQIFRILDTNERGSVNIKELTQGFMRMRGSAKSKDLMVRLRGIPIRPKLLYGAIFQFDCITIPIQASDS